MADFINDGRGSTSLSNLSFCPGIATDCDSRQGTPDSASPLDASGLP